MANIVQWMVNAKKGEVYEYARGNLAFMRHEASVNFIQQRPMPAAQLDMLDQARDAWTAYAKGLITLVQRRKGHDDFSYLAMRL